ncbi:hypothetical protein [Quatrionicoccus australiensis]|uniref:hypothetical protein n=1 Tax=Quatrionicoccus australiensis TaxID=138118 RepID=UPI001CF85B3E|nr:hypothetical protein [Quatrionicoccus australiensis]UCV13765.1 hypothetical protein KI612_12450 [Quatrionicoccus australiensis]
MRVLREVAIPGRENKVIVRELTVGEIRSWLAAKVQPGDLVDSMLIADISISDLLILSDLTNGEIEELTPAELDLVITAAKEINVAFFAMREKMVDIGTKILAAPPG